MKIPLNLMMNMMRRVGNNPFASHKTRARKLLLLLQEEGYVVVQGHRVIPEDNITDNTQPEHVAVHEPVVTTHQLTRPEQARRLYQTSSWSALYAYKRAAKVSWQRLGFDFDEEVIIVANKPAD